MQIANRLEKMEHNGRFRLKKSTLTNLGGGTDSVRESPSMREAAHVVNSELPSNVVVFEAFQRAAKP